MVSLPRRKTFLIVRAIIVACFFALFFSLPLTWLDHSQSQVTIAHAQDCDPYSDPDCPPPDQGPQCDYEQWSDEYDCSGGYRCYNDYFQDPSTDCQPQAKSPRYHCDRDSACDDAPQGCTAGEVNRSDIGCQGDQYCYDVTIQDASCDQEQRTECVSDTSCQDQGGGNGGGGGPSCSGGQVDDGNGSCVCPNGTSWDGSQCTGSGGGTPAQCTYQEQNVNGTCNGTDWCYQTHTQYEDCSENTTDWICSYYAGCDTGGGGGGQTCSYSQDYVNGQCSGDQYCQQVKTTNEDCSESLSDWQCFPDTSCQDQGGGNGGGGGQTCSAYDDRRLRSYCDNSGNLCTDYESRSDSCDTTSRTDCQPDTSCQDQGGGNGGGGGPSCSGGQVDDGNGSCVCPNGTSWDGSQCTGSGGGGGGGGGQQQSCSETQVQTNGHCDGDQWCVDIQNRDTSCNWSDGGQNCQFDSSCQNQIQNPQTGGSQNTCEPSTNTSNSRCEGDQLCNDIYTIDASCNTNSDTKCDYSEGCAAQNSPQNTEPEPTAEPTQATCDLQPYSQEYGDCQTNNGQRCFNDYDVDQASCSYIPRTNSDGNVYHCDPDPSCPQPSPEESPSPEVSPAVACDLQPTSVEYGDCQVNNGQRCYNDFDVDQATCTLVPRVNSDGNVYHCDPDPSCPQPSAEEPSLEESPSPEVSPTVACTLQPTSKAYDCSHDQRCFNDFDVDQTTCTLVPKVNEDGNTFHCDPDPKCAGDVNKIPQEEIDAKLSVTPTPVPGWKPPSLADITNGAGALLGALGNGVDQLVYDVSPIEDCSQYGPPSDYTKENDPYGSQRHLAQACVDKANLANTFGSYFAEKNREAEAQANLPDTSIDCRIALADYMTRSSAGENPSWPADVCGAQKFSTRTPEQARDAAVAAATAAPASDDSEAQFKAGLKELGVDVNSDLAQANADCTAPADANQDVSAVLRKCQALDMAKQMGLDPNDYANWDSAQRDLYFGRVARSDFNLAKATGEIIGAPISSYENMRDAEGICQKTLGQACYVNKDNPSAYANISDADAANLTKAGKQVYGDSFDPASTDQVKAYADILARQQQVSKALSYSQGGYGGYSSLAADAVPTTDQQIAQSMGISVDELQNVKRTYGVWGGAANEIRTNSTAGVQYQQAQEQLQTDAAVGIVSNAFDPVPVLKAIGVGGKTAFVVSKSGFGKLVANLGEKEAEELAPRLAVAAGKAARGEVLDQAEKDVLVKGAEAAGTNADEFVGVFDQAAAPSDAQLVSAVQSNDIVVPLQAPALDQAVSAEGVDAAARQGLADAGDGTVAQASVVSAGEAPAPGVSAPEKPVVVIEPSSAAPVTPGGDNPITTLGDDIDAALHPAASVDHPDVAPQNPVVAAVVDSTPADVPVVELPTGPVLADPERVAADVAETTAKPGAVAERSVDSAEPVAVEPARVASVLDDADQGLAEQAAAERSSNPVVAAAQDAGDTAARLTDDAATTGDDLLKKATGQEPDLPAIGPKEEPKPIAEGQIAEATPLTGDDIVYHGEEPCPAGLAAELPLAFADGKKAVLAASTVVGPTGCKISIDGDNSNHGEDAQGAAKAGGIVADGISQGGNSKYASKAAVESAQRDMQSLPTRVQRMDAATQQNLRQQAEGVMQNANQAAASARPRGAGQGYGTTFQAAHIVTDAQGNHTAMIFGVADSPAYILKPDGTMTRVLTNPDLVARGDVIGADEVARRGLDERYVGALKQSLGTGQPLKLTPDHVQFVPLQKGDRVFLMSDGPEKVFPELSQKQAPTIGKILAQTKPGEGAESLMNGVRNVTGGRMPDDMSVAEILHPDFPTNGRAQQPAASAQARAAADQAQANAQKAAAEQAQAQAQAHARQAAASAAAGDYAGARASVENAFGQASLAERIAQANPNNAAARTAADAANKRANEGLSALTFEATRAKSNAEGAGLRVESRLNDARAGSPADARGAADQAVKARTAAQNAKDAADQLQELARGDPRFQAHADYARQEAAAADAAATQAEEKATQVSQVAADQRRAASQQANGSGQTNQGQQTGSQGSNTTGNGQAGNTSAGAAPKRPTNRPSYFTNPFLPDSLRDEVIVASDGTIRDVVNINPFDFMSTNPEYRVTYADGTTRIVHYNDLITDAERSAADARTAAASARSAGVGAGTTGSTRPAGSGAASGAVVDTPEMAAYRAAVKTQNELSDIFAMKYGRDPGSPLTPEDEALLRKYGFGPDILKLNDSDLYAKMHINDEEVRVAREHPNLTEAQRNLVLDSIDDPNAGKPAGGSSQAGAQQAAPGPQGQGSQAAPGTSGGAGSAGPSTSGRAASQVAPAPGVKPESSPRVNAYTKSKKVVDDLTTIDGIRSGHGPGITISDADEKLLAEYGFPTDPSKLNETEINRQLTAAKASLDRAKNNRDFVRELNVDNVNPTIVKQLKDVDPEIVAVTFRPESIDGQLSYTVTYKDGTTRTLTHDQNILVNAQKVVDERDAAVAAAAAKKAAEEVADKANQPVLDAMIGQDLYARLGVPRTASDREIKVAYARLIAKYHPDRNPGAVASDIARLLNESRDVLTSGDARTGRAAYDGGTYRPTMANTARENNVKRAQAAAAGSAPGGTTGRAGATGGSTGTGSTTGSAGQPGSSRTTNPGAGQTGSTGTGSTPGGTSAGPRTSAGGGSGGGQTPPGPNRATGNTSGGGQAPGNVGPVGPSAARPSTGGFGAQARGFVDNLRQGVTSTWNQGPEGKAAVILAGVSGVTGGGIIGCSVPTLWGSNPCNARLYQSAGKPSSTQPVAVVPTPVVKTPTGSAVATSQPGGVAATSTATSTSQLTSSAGGPVSPNASQGGPTSTATARGASATSTSTPANTPTAGSTATSQPVSPSQGGPSATSTSTTSTANSTATPYPTATIIPGYCSNFNPPTKSREFDCSNGERCYDDYELNPYNCKYVAHKNDNGAPFHCDPDPSCGEQLIGSRATRTIPGTPADQVPPPIPPVATAPINSTSTPTAGSTATSQPVSPSQGGPALATATPATPTYCSDYATTSYSQEYSCAKGLRCFNDYDLDSGTCTFVPRTNADGSWYHCDADASCAGEQPEVSPGAPATNSSPAQGTSSSTSPGTTTAGPASQPVQVIPASGTSAQVTANSQSQATSEQPGATVVSTAAGAVGAAIGQVIGGAPGAAVGQAGGEALAGVGQAIANGGIGAGVGQIVQAGVNIVNGVLGQAGLGSPNATSSATLNGNVTYDGPGCFNNHSVIMKIYKDGHEEYLKDYGVVPGECGNAKPATCGEQANFLQCGGTSGLDGKEPTHLFQVTPNYVCDTNIMQYNVVDLGAKDPCLSHPVKPASVENGGACIANDQCVPGSICSPMGVCAKGAQTYSLKIDRDKCDQSNLGGLGTACFDAATVGNYFGLPTSAASLYHHNISFTAVSYDEQTGVCQYQLVDFGKNDSCDLKQVPAKSRKIGENCSENKECDSGVCSIYPPVCVEQIVHDRITGSVKNPQDSCSEYQQGTFSCYPKKGNYYQHRVDIVVTQENLSCSYNIVDMGKGDCSGVTPSSTPTRP